jgi:tRNA(adenine34) deaminase
MLKNDEFWMQLALKQARLAFKQQEVPVGAVLVCQKSGHYFKSHNVSRQKHDACAHAEIEVIRQAGQVFQNYRLVFTTLYVTLEPCVMCAGAIIQARIPRIVFATRDWLAGAAGSRLNVLHHQSSNHHVHIDEGILQEEARLLLQRFFELQRLK